MLSNSYFLAKFGFDAAENEPAKKMQNFAEKLKKALANHEGAGVLERAVPREHRALAARVRDEAVRGAIRGVEHLGDL